MDPVKPLSQKWPGTRALMLVHGIGDYHPGDYDDLLQELQQIAGADKWAGTAVYPFFYDAINDWMVQKTQLKAGVQALLDGVHNRFVTDTNRADLASAASEGVADVLWPALVRDARLAIRDALIAQVLQIVLDGRAANVPRWKQQISIICHSLGCVHTYELLHAAANNPIYELRPVSDWVQFENVIMFASPVHLYQSVGLSEPLRLFIPNAEEMACFNGPLRMPGQLDMESSFVRSVKRFVAVTGRYDPVGGFLLGKRLPWAAMDSLQQGDGFTFKEDPQNDLPFAQLPDQLAPVLGSSLVGANGPRLPLQNPHSWTRYITQNQEVVSPCFG